MRESMQNQGYTKQAFEPNHGKLKEFWRASLQSIANHQALNRGHHAQGFAQLDI
jgi:hypothetical protein